MNDEAPPGSFHVKGSHNLLEGLAELQVWLASNRVSEAFQLNLRVTFDEFNFGLKFDPSQQRGLFWFGRKNDLQSGENKYRVRVRHCKLRMRSTEFELRQDDKYKDIIQAGKFTQHTSEKFELRNKSGISGGASATLAVSSHGLDAGVRAKGGGDASRSAAESETSHSTTKSEVRLIDHIPFGWKIGVPGKGDPFQEANDYCLAGTYFDRPSKSHPYSCTVRFKSNSTSGQLTFVLSCRDSFIVDRIDSQGHIVDREESDRIISEMRQKIAGVLVEKQLTEEGAAVNHNGELILAIVQAEAQQESDERHGDEKPPPRSGEPPLGSSDKVTPPRDSSGRFTSRKGGHS